MTSQEDAADVGGDVGDDQQPIEENVNGWVWQRDQGWFDLPLDAAIDPTGTLGTKVWHRARSAWIYVTGRGLTPGDNSIQNNN